MTVTPINENAMNIRKMDVRRDLNQIADLVEKSFPIHLDPDGQIYIQKMRKAARDIRLWSWLNPWTEFADITASGFVWEQDDRIVGNLSLIPFQNEGRKLYLIANVAVHPTQRRRGIARALTRRAVNYLRRRNISEVWLQVREDNLHAQELYRSVGFQERAVRTTWRIQPCERREDSLPEFRVQYLRRRRTADWWDQKKWLDMAYPHDIRWNYPLTFDRLSPGLLQRANNLIEGVKLRQWTYDIGEYGRGQIAWQKTDTYANNLWLAFKETQEFDLLPGALISVLKQLAQDHPVSIDYPKDRSKFIFETLGFKPFRTLIWMACSL